VPVPVLYHTKTKKDLTRYFLIPKTPESHACGNGLFLGSKICQEHRWMVPIIRVCFTKDDNSAAGDYRAPPVQASHSKAHAGGGVVSLSQ